ncbi:MAG: hypothetical protein A2166_02620 [Omnitrophica WOR_2 bacterium RBG_13_41_10]|nr:MAG: hypothetical protein A2166_02620 [Omnitrophica WOR_2 bacterium RBG_13_41_10]
MVLIGIILAIIFSFVGLIAHLIISFFRKGRAPDEPVIFELSRQMKLLMWIWGILLLPFMFLFFFPPSAIIVLANRLNSVIAKIDFSYGIIIYLFLAFIYLTLYYLVNRSVSATILELIETSQNKRLSVSEIKQRYDIENKYQSELKGMLEGGFITQESQYYSNTLKGKIFAAIASFMKQQLKLGAGG